MYEKAENQKGRQQLSQYSHSKVKMGTKDWILFFLIFISWRLINLQYCSGFHHRIDNKYQKAKITNLE